MAMRLDEEAERSAEARAQAQQAAEAAQGAAESVAHRLEKIETVVEAAAGRLRRRREGRDRSHAHG